MRSVCCGKISFSIKKSDIIEIGANDRAVYQQSISCFIVYANFDWFLINLLFTLSSCTLNLHSIPKPFYIRKMSYSIFPSDNGIIYITPCKMRFRLVNTAVSAC